jgi:PAS domain S-box-containing protein
MNDEIKILLVDDIKENLFSLKAILDEEKYTLVTASSGQEALKILLSDVEFALILLDVQMPLMDGFETAHHIQTKKNTSNIPIIFVTATSYSDIKIFEGYKTGAVDYIHKPLVKSILLAKVAVFANLYRMRLEATKQSKFLESLNNKLALATIAGGVGIWDWNISTNTLIWDDQMYCLYGLKKSDFSGAYDSWRNGIHPDDIKRCDEEIALALSGKKEWNTEFKVVWPDKSIHYIRAIGNVQLDTSGNPINMVGTNWDISDDKETEQLLEKKNKQIKDNETLIRNIYEASIDSAIIIDELGLIQRWDSKAEQLFGWKEKEVIGIKLSEIIVPHRLREKHEKGMKRFSKTGESVMSGKVIEMKALKKNGLEIDTELRIIKTRLNNKICFIGFIHDITEKIKIKKELEIITNSALYFKNAVYNTSLVSKTDVNGSITFVNDKFIKLSGYSEKELIGKNHRIINSGFHKKEFWTDMWKKVLAGNSWRAEVKNKAKNGEYYWVDTFIFPIKNRQDEMEEILSIRNDITDRKVIEEKLKVSEELLTEAQKIAKIGSWNVHFKKKEATWSEELFNIFDLPNDNSIKDLYSAYLSKCSPEDQTKIKTAMKNTAEAGESFSLIHEVKTPSGTKFLNGIAHQWRNEKNEIIGVKGVSQDVTELITKNNELKKYLNALNTAQSISKLGSYEFDFITEKMDWSEELYSMLEVDTNTKKEKLFPLILNIASNDSLAITKTIENSRTTGEPFRLEYQVSISNSLKNLLINGHIIKDINNKITGIAGTVQDITELKKNQENLELYRMMIENSKDPIFMIDDEDDCRMIYVNEAARSHFGKPLEEIYTWRIPDWDPGFTYNDLSKHVEDIKKIGHLDIESRHKINDGEIVPVAISLSKFVYNGRLCHFGYFKNITERKQKEQELQDLIENLNDKTALLESANKEMESFSYSVSHDLRAPLRAINSFAEILALDFSKILPSEAKKHLERIRGNALKMGNLIDQLLAFSRLGRKTITKYQVDTAHIVTSIIREICIDHAAAKTFFKVGNMLPVPGDVALLKQVFTNLISNAYKYSHKNASPSIEIGSKHNSKEITYYIKDNGVGFDMRYYDKIFGIFQRLHSESEFEGTGVGLAIVLKIVTAHGGRVWAESKVNKGSCFYFTIPLDES